MQVSLQLSISRPCMYGSLNLFVCMLETLTLFLVVFCSKLMMELRYTK